MFFTEQKLLMSFSRTLHWQQSIAGEKKSLCNPLIRISLPLFSKTIRFAVLCSGCGWERAGPENREHCHLKCFNATLQSARPRVKVNAAGEGGMRIRRGGLCRRVQIRVIRQPQRELSYITLSTEGRGKGGGGGGRGGARGREKHWAIKGHRKPWWSSRALRCFEIKASFEDVEIWFSLLHSLVVN